MGGVYMYYRCMGQSKIGVGTKYLLGILLVLFLSLTIVSSASAATTAQVKVSTNRFVVLDDPNSGNAGSGAINPGASGSKSWGTDYWNGEATTIRAYAAVIDSDGSPVSGASVSFTLKNPGGSTVNTATATTDASGIATYTYNINGQNYYGTWTVEATSSAVTGSATFVSNWWGCAWCHGNKGSPASKMGTWTNPSPFTQGFRFHQNPKKNDHSDLMDNGHCDFCHQVYDGPPAEVRDKNEKGDPEDVVYPAGVHNGQEECENCHANTDPYNNNDPGIPDCFSCHPNNPNQEVSSVSTISGGKTIYGADETNSYVALKAHSTGASVPCITCHNAMHNITKPDPTPATTNTITDTSQCTGCHSPRVEHNNQVECRTCHSGDAHAIKFLSTSGTLLADKNQAANCDDCHQGSNLDAYLSSKGLSAPKVPQSFNHSDDANAGSLWNETTPGYLGPWNVAGAGSNLNACLYCHGATKHKASALGRVSAALGGGNVIDGPISATSEWCGSCHYPGNADYNAMMTEFDNAGLERPPDNTNEPGAGFFDHTATLSSDASDSKCETCHGGLLSGGANMTEFVHNVGVGAAGGDDCISCHGIDYVGASPSVPTAFEFNISAFKNGVHLNINNTPLNTATNDDCWSCHFNKDMNRTNINHCWDCHNQARNGEILNWHSGSNMSVNLINLIFGARIQQLGIPLY